jgi:uncharacterized protein YgiM (DUF1202 family)
MKKRKNRDVTNWRNEKKDIYAIFGDNKKYLMPAILIVAVVATVVIAINANQRAQEVAQSTVATSEVSTYEVPDATMEENAYPDVNALVEQYYKASADGDADTLAKLYKGLDETEVLKSVAASEYIDNFQNISVYTKPGPVEGSYVAYVYNEVKLYDYDGLVPGLETLYICTDDNGSLYINGDIADANELEYLKQINVQADVIDLNNKVASSYNEMVSADENLAELLTKMRSGLQVSVGEALATSEGASAEDTSDEASEESGAESGKKTITTRIIKATDVINIRSSDSETADILDKTQKGNEYKELEALANGWSKIEYKGSVAYVKTEFFDIVSEETTVIENTEEENEDAASNESSGDEDKSTESASAASTEDKSASSTASTEDKSATSASTSKDSSSASASSTKDSSSASASSTKDNSAASSSTDSTGKVLTDAKTGKTVVEQSIKLRKEPSTDSDALDTVYAGLTVNVIEQYSNGWAKVEYGKKTGYVKSEYLRK